MELKSWAVTAVFLLLSVVLFSPSLAELCFNCSKHFYLLLRFCVFEESVMYLSYAIFFFLRFCR